MEVFIRFNWMKMDNSLLSAIFWFSIPSSMQTSICTLDKDKIAIRTVLLLEVMDIHNIVALAQDEEKVLTLDLLDIKNALSSCLHPALHPT